MSGQYRTVAVQAIGVAVIAAIIFVVFLHTDEPGELSGIEANGDEEQSVADPKPENDPIEKRSKGPEGDDQRRNGSNEPGRPQPGEFRGGGSTGGAGGASGSAGSAGGDIPFRDGDDDTPPVDQYDDLVTRLMQQVGEPSLYREIDSGP